MAKDVILEANLGGAILSAEELAAIPDFAGIRKEIWDKFPGAIVRQEFQPGQILMREGDNGTTAFYILSGTVEIFINNPVSRVESRRSSGKGFFSGLTKITNYITGMPAAKSGSTTTRTHIPMDAPVDLPMDNPIAEVVSGDLIGELAALAALKQERLKRPKFYPRSATARAKTAVVALEMLPNILNNVLYNAPAFKDKLNKNYRSRALDTHLRSVPIFRNLSPEFIDYLRQKVELVDVTPGQVICRQGEIADSFYLIRMGFVKVSQIFPGGELVLTYLSRGSYFGEMGLLPPVFRVRAKGLKPGQVVETAVSSGTQVMGRAPSGEGAFTVPWDEYLSREHASMRVEGKQLRVARLSSGKNPITFRMKPVEGALVSPGESFVIGETTFEVIEDPLQAGRRTATCTAVDFVQLVRIKADDFAKMMADFPEVEAGITEVARVRRKMDLELLGRVQQASLSSFLEQELMQGQNLLLLDLNKCTRCDECVKACVATHSDGVTRLVRDGLRFENFLVATSCRACMDPLCMTRCPVGSIRRKDTLDIVIEDWCIGCGNCATDCPYGNINVVQLDPSQGKQKAEPRPKAVVCDLCAEFPEPNCVRACPHDAAIRVEPKSFFARDLAGMRLAVPMREFAPMEAPETAAPADQAAMETKIYSNVGELLDMLPRLKIVSGPRSGSFLQLRYPSTSFGRGAGNDYRFADDTVMSRAQAVVICEGNRFLLRDLNSTNGTLVNGNTVAEMELHPGDIIEMGEMQMEFLGGTGEMIVDRRQTRWGLGSAVASAALLALYFGYVALSPNGARGGSAMGLFFASLGTGIIVFECLLGARKKYPASRLGRVKTWLKAHCWLGLISFLLILMHSGFHWGHGLAAALMWIFAVIVASGIFGVALQNYIPRRMTELVVRETIFEQIPTVVRGLRTEADERVEFVTADLGLEDDQDEYIHAGGVKQYFDPAQKKSAAEKVQAVVERRKSSPQIELEESAREALRAHYLQEVRPFLVDSPAPLSARLFRSRDNVGAYFEHLRTVMPVAAHDLLRDLQDICEERRQLGVQRKLHVWLHSWLMVHVPLSFALLVLTALHAVLSLRY